MKKLLLSLLTAVIILNLSACNLFERTYRIELSSNTIDFDKEDFYNQVAQIVKSDSGLRIDMLMIDFSPDGELRRFTFSIVGQRGDRAAHYQGSFHSDEDDYITMRRSWMNGWDIERTEINLYPNFFYQTLQNIDRLPIEHIIGAIGTSRTDFFSIMPHYLQSQVENCGGRHFKVELDGNIIAYPANSTTENIDMSLIISNMVFSGYINPPTPTGNTSNPGRNVAAGTSVGRGWTGSGRALYYFERNDNS